MKSNMDSELLLKFIGYFPDCLSGLSTTFVETAAYLGKDYKIAFLSNVLVKFFVMDKIN